jgi:IS5 family transposase
MFKALVIQSLFNLSDAATEYLIKDRLTFMRFVGVGIGDRVPDEKTIWLFREQLGHAGLVDQLFERFDAHLRTSGFAARKGQIVDASIVAVPRQRNTRDENVQIKNGDTPEGWSESKKRQKDTDARWVKRGGQNHFGYKNHISIDVKNKFIRLFDVTDAATHEIHIFQSLLDAQNTNRDVYADSAYRSPANLEMLARDNWREKIQRRSGRQHKLTKRERQGNHTRSRIRSRVEHIFGVQKKRAGTLIVRTIGLVRARTKIGLRNLVFNLDRYGGLLRPAGG